MAKPTIDISAYRAKLDQDFAAGKVSPREYRRLQTGMGNVANGQNQGYSYQIDPGSRSFKAENNGVQAKGKIGGVTATNPLAGRKTSKAIAYIAKNQEENPPSTLGASTASTATASQAPTAPTQPSGSTQTTQPAQKSSTRHQMSGVPRSNVGSQVRMTPAMITPSLFQNPFKGPETPNFKAPGATTFMSVKAGQTNPPSPTPKGGGDGDKKTPTVPSLQTASGATQTDAPKGQKPSPKNPVQPVAPVLPQGPDLSGKANSIKGYVNSLNAPKTNPVSVSPNDYMPRNPAMDQANMEAKIKDYQDRIALAKRNPTNKAYEDYRNNSGYYQKEIDRLRAEYKSRFGKQYGGSIDMKTGAYLPSGVKPFGFKPIAKPVSVQAPLAPTVPASFNGPWKFQGTHDRYGHRIIMEKGGKVIPKFEGGFRFLNPSSENMYSQSGRQGMDMGSVLNTAMGAYGLFSGLTNKSPKVPVGEKLNSGIRPMMGDYDTLARNLKSINSNYGSMGRSLRNNAGSDKTTFIRGMLGANQFRNQAAGQAYLADSQIRVQDRQRVDYQKMAQDQYNNQLVNQYHQNKFAWDAQRWQNRALGSQRTLDSALNYGEERRANMYNNEIALKKANAELGMQEGTLRTQVYNEWVRNNGGVPPTEEQLNLEMQKLIPKKPTLFS